MRDPLRKARPSIHPAAEQIDVCAGVLIGLRGTAEELREEIQATRSRNLVWSERRLDDSHQVDWNPALDYLAKTTSEVDSWISGALALAASAHESEDRGQLRFLEVAVTRAGQSLRVIAIYLAGIRSAQYALHDAPGYVVGGLGFNEGVIEWLNALYAKLEAFRIAPDPAKLVPELDAIVGETTTYIDAYFQGIRGGAQLEEAAHVISIVTGAVGLGQALTMTARLLAGMAVEGGEVGFALAGGAAGRAGAMAAGASLQGVVRGLAIAAAAGTITFQKRGGAEPVNVGKEGERRVGISGPKVRIPSANGSAKFRVPDRVTELTVEEVKNTLNVSRTRQLEDYLEFCRRTDRTLVLWVRSTTKIASSLNGYIDSGLLEIAFIP